MDGVLVDVSHRFVSLMKLSVLYKSFERKNLGLHMSQLKMLDGQISFSLSSFSVDGLIVTWLVLFSPIVLM